jgi:hypothetical protein
MAYLDPEAGKARETRRISGEGLYGEVKTARADYDFAVEGGAVGTVDLSTDEIPAGALIVGARVRVETIPVGATATIGIGVEANSDVQAAAAISGAPWSTVGVKDMTGRPITTAARKIKATIATAALTAGKFQVYIDYIDTRAA